MGRLSPTRPGSAIRCASLRQSVSRDFRIDGHTFDIAPSSKVTSKNDSRVERKRPGQQTVAGTKTRNFSLPFLAFVFFSALQDRELLGAILAIYWIVHVDFKVHRLRDGIGV